MATNNVYRTILLTMPPGVEQRIMEILIRHVGSENRIKRRDLVFAVFGRVDQKPAQTSTLDRQVRSAIARMQERGIPILSDSGQGGYWLGTKAECVNFIKEQQDRQAALARKINGIKKLWKISPNDLQARLPGV
ncbi:hypothetical protein ADN00_15545 [Ornatilinea apprima]|uniref:Helix-turn-helix type 11 domain-containing protein n=1 Tax=Ornatilinea apprima TaxID=1134406 RepID=A0A0P6WZJ2_9CHLR|nr:hypothetical protein [Ornatilinea apprima]KPL72232.1 hypothetical protein ADN00_15545 [Ornatilinea apprima]